jgi:hypothetical protein
MSLTTRETLSLIARTMDIEMATVTYQTNPAVLSWQALNLFPGRPWNRLPPQGPQHNVSIPLFPPFYTVILSTITEFCPIHTGFSSNFIALDHSLLLYCLCLSTVPKIMIIRD